MVKLNIITIFSVILIICFFSLLIFQLKNITNEKEEVALNNECDIILEHYYNWQLYCFKNSTLIPIEFKCNGFINVKCEIFYT